ncbi:MAG TPA: lysophospholipid acyltransferase family protein [Alphaproteobacteria bacterium]|nr:lysophospholipid acyltransferase family protein [Alphaproteobacteria bacterium]
MIWVRSIAFNGIFYSWTLFFALLFSPVLLFPRAYILKVSKIWVFGVFWICEHILGLHVKIIGKEKLTLEPAILAIKHQSAWETIFFNYILADPTIVLKQELLWIPFFGWYLKRLGMVPLSRSSGKGAQDLRKLLRSAEQAVARGQPILIFPEGTRSKPGQKGAYHSGVASLYRHLKIPVIPVAHNAGLFWPRRGFRKSAGQITLEILDPIEPGLSRQEFMGILENRIESKTNALVQLGLNNAKKS